MKKLTDMMQAKYPDFDSEMAMKLGLPPNMYNFSYFLKIVTFWNKILFS